MPTYALWTLVVALVILALGLAYTIAELRHSLGLKKKEIDGFLTRITSLEKAINHQSLETKTEINPVDNKKDTKIPDHLKLDSSIAPEIGVTETEILKELFKIDSECSAKHFSEILKIENGVVVYHLDNLLESKMIDNGAFHLDEPETYIINRNGRKHVVEQKII